MSQSPSSTGYTVDFRTEQRIPMSYEEFLEYAADIHAEWVDGEAIIFMPPKIIHQQIIGFLYIVLSLYARSRNLGVVMVAPVAMQLGPGAPFREPDLLFLAEEHRDRLTADRLEGAADLIVEVVSDSSVARDRVDKFYEYQEAGVAEYWLIDPRPGKERVDFYQLQGDGRYQAALPDAQGRYHAAVVPGFWIDVHWLWQEPLPDPLGALQQIVASGPQC
jgi:Uma2 family endonuclease